MYKQTNNNVYTVKLSMRETVNVIYMNVITNWFFFFYKYLYTYNIYTNDIYVTRIEKRTIYTMGSCVLDTWWYNRHHAVSN